MAKAKKTETTGKSSSKKPAAKNSPAKKPATAAAAPTAPMVDTSLAAQNAAKLLAAGLPRKTANPPAAPSKTESAMFKNLKQGLAKPHLTGLEGILDKSAPTDQKRSNLPFGGTKQVGHNQTFGADVTRSGVPRRTPG